MGQLVDRPKFEEGKHAYQGGMNLADVMDRVHENRERAEAGAGAEPGVLHFQHIQDAEVREVSFVLGFVQGALDDLRMVAARC